MNEKKLTKKLLTFVISVFMGFAGKADAITLTQSVNKTEMAFEDSIKFEITVEWNGPQFAFRFTNPLNPYIDRLRVGRFSSSINSAGKDKDEVTTKKFTYVLEPTSSGLGKIDPIKISYVSWPDSIPGEMITEKVSISIADQILKENSDSSNLWFYLIAGLILAGGGAGVFIAKSKAANTKVPIKTPVDMALEELAKVTSESGSDLKKFQTGVYSLLSDFLKTRYNMNVGGLTQSELEVQISKTSLSVPQKSGIIDWLMQAERDKFGPIEASPGETVRLENDLRKFFENLKV